MSSLTLSLHNRSTSATNYWSFCVYQVAPDGSNPNIVSLAWLAAPCAYGNDVEFSWDMNYKFQWSKCGVLQPGVRFKSSGERTCDPFTTANCCDLNALGETYQFADPTKTTGKGNLMIHTGENIRPDVALGISMGGKPVFAVPATSNSDHLFIPKPKYYVTLGMFKEGTVMDYQGSVDPCEVSFQGLDFLDITLDENFHWQKRNLVAANIEATERLQIEKAAMGV